jgi:hypothetical protein
MINKIFNKEELLIDHPVFEVTIKQNGEIVYQHSDYAGAVSVVEKVKTITSEFEVEGVTQKFMFGHPIIIFFAFDQLKKSFESKIIGMVEYIKKTYEKLPDGMERLIKVGLFNNIKGD